jgi:TRAP transporter 4TM/12TM fusion protein
VTYWSIVVAAFIPAILYFIAVFIMVDARAARLGLHGLPRSECPPVFKSLKEGWLFFLPLLTLLFFLGVLLYSPQTSILYALGVLLLLNMSKWVSGASRKEAITVQAASQSAWRVSIKGLRGGAAAMLIPGIACAAAGILLGALSITQIGIPLSEAAVTFAGDNQLVLLILAAFACFILGMGMGSLPAYIMVVIIVAPALLAFGVPPLLTHFFVFWFAITCFVTPPVAVGAYVAAAIAGASPMKTALRAVGLGFCVYTLPFMFVYNPALLLQGSPIEIVLAAVTALVGVSLFSLGIGGHFLRSTNWPQRLLFLAGGAMFMTLNLQMVLIGLALGIIAIGWQIRAVRRERAAEKGF